jgi:hypothetical protein
MYCTSDKVVGLFGSSIPVLLRNEKTPILFINLG